MEEVRVRAAEPADAIHAERVIPDHPTPAGEAQFALGDQLQLRGVFVADGQPERAVGLQRPVHAGHPFPRPVDIFFAVPLVVVDVVLVADIEGRIGKRQIDAAGLHFAEQFNAVALMHVVNRQSHGFPPKCAAILSVKVQHNIPSSARGRQSPMHRANRTACGSRRHLLGCAAWHTSSARTRPDTDPTWGRW